MVKYKMYDGDEIMNNFNFLVKTAEEQTEDSNEVIEDLVEHGVLNPDPSGGDEVDASIILSLVDLADNADGMGKAASAKLIDKFINKWAQMQNATPLMNQLNILNQKINALATKLPSFKEGDQNKDMALQNIQKLNAQRIKVKQQIAMQQQQAQKQQQQQQQPAQQQQVAAVPGQTPTGNS